MLTSHPYLLGSFVAVTCVIGTATNGLMTLQNNGLSGIGSMQPTSVKTLNVSYRGSGRADDAPPEAEKTITDKRSIAHRGSGRITTQTL